MTKWRAFTSGLVGMGVILSWAWGLVREACAVRLDVTPDQRLLEKIRTRLEQDGDRVTDLHVWRVGAGHFAAVISLVSDAAQAPHFYKARLSGLRGLSHITVEVDGFFFALNSCVGPRPARGHRRLGDHRAPLPVKA